MFSREFMGHPGVHAELRQRVRLGMAVARRHYLVGAASDDQQLSVDERLLSYGIRQRVREVDGDESSVREGDYV